MSAFIQLAVTARRVPEVSGVSYTAEDCCVGVRLQIYEPHVLILQSWELGGGGKQLSDIADECSLGLVLYADL